MRSRWAGPIAFVLLLGGCRSCRSGDERPPPAVVETETRKRLAEQPDLVSKVCGVDVKRLTNITVETLTAKDGVQKVRVTGNPASDDGTPVDEEDDDDDAGVDGGPTDAGATRSALGGGDAGPVVVSKGKALLCAAILTIEVKRVFDDDGKLTKWGSGELKIDTIETGKAIAPPVTGGTRHHRRRHHHH